jgi:hypothetical protein
MDHPLTYYASDICRFTLVLKQSSDLQLRAVFSDNVGNQLSITYQ